LNQLTTAMQHHRQLSPIKY